MPGAEPRLAYTPGGPHRLDRTAFRMAVDGSADPLEAVRPFAGWSGSAGLRSMFRAWRVHCVEAGRQTAAGWYRAPRRRTAGRGRVAPRASSRVGLVFDISGSYVGPDLVTLR